MYNSSQTTLEIISCVTEFDWESVGNNSTCVNWNKQYMRAWKIFTLPAPINDSNLDKKWRNLSVLALLGLHFIYILADGLTFFSPFFSSAQQCSETFHVNCEEGFPANEVESVKLEVQVLFMKRRRKTYCVIDARFTWGCKVRDSRLQEDMVMLVFWLFFYSCLLLQCGNEAVPFFWCHSFCRAIPDAPLSSTDTILVLNGLSVSESSNIT